MKVKHLKQVIKDTIDKGSIKNDTKFLNNVLNLLNYCVELEKDKSRLLHKHKLLNQTLGRVREEKKEYKTKLQEQLDTNIDDLKLTQLIYSNLRRNFEMVVDEVLGPDYYNSGMDSYTCDRLTCEDIINKKVKVLFSNKKYSVSNMKINEYIQFVESNDKKTYSQQDVIKLLKNLYDKR